MQEKIFFTDRLLVPLLSSDSESLHIDSATIEESLASGTSSLTADVSFEQSAYRVVTSAIQAGGYAIVSSGHAYQVTECEIDMPSCKIHLYGEDAGLDLLNELVSDYEGHGLTVEQYATAILGDSGYSVGIVERPGVTMDIEWTGDATVVERLRDLATRFNLEMSYRFLFDGMAISKKFIDFYVRRGRSSSGRWSVGREITSVTSRSTIDELYTAVYAYGGEGGSAVDLVGYTYDDGRYYVTPQGAVCDRVAAEQWGSFGRYGYIYGRQSFDVYLRADIVQQAIRYLQAHSMAATELRIELSHEPVGAAVGSIVWLMWDEVGWREQVRIIRTQRDIVTGEYAVEVERWTQQ